MKRLLAYLPASYLLCYLFYETVTQFYVLHLSVYLLFITNFCVVSFLYLFYQEIYCLTQLTLRILFSLHVCILRNRACAMCYLNPKKKPVYDVAINLYSAECAIILLYFRSKII